MQTATKVLSVRQPWAWLIVNGHKPVENREWWSLYRGRLLIHASQGMTRAEYEDCAELLDKIAGPTLRLPDFKQLERGGIVGAVDMDDCVLEHSSPWFFGRYGFVLSNPVAVRLIPCKGALGFFRIPGGIIEQVRQII